MHIFVICKNRRNMAILRRTYADENGRLVIEEIVSDEMIQVPKKHKLNNGNFITLFQNAMLNIVFNMNLSKGAYRLLIYLIGKTEINNEIKLTLYSISKEIGEKQPNIVRYFKELESFNIAIRNKERKTIRLNYDLAYKGKIKEYNKLKFSDPEMINSPKKDKNQLKMFNE